MKNNSRSKTLKVQKQSDKVINKNKFNKFIREVIRMRKLQNKYAIINLPSILDEIIWHGCVIDDMISEFMNLEKKQKL